MALNSLSQSDYAALLEKCDAFADELRDFTGAMCVDASGTVLPAVAPASFLYIACGESQLLYVDADLRIVSVQPGA